MTETVYLVFSYCEKTETYKCVEKYWDLQMALEYLEKHPGSFMVRGEQLQ